jgi:Mrp family chromosome partitioning ATPase
MSTDATVPSVDPTHPSTGSPGYIGEDTGYPATPPAKEHPLRSQCELVYQGLSKGVLPSDSPSHSVGVTSCYQGEGVTTVASQLALVAAAAGRKVVLVDAHFASPALHTFVDAPLAPGLTDALCDDRPFGEIAWPVPEKNIALVSAGSAVPAMGSCHLRRLREFVRFTEEEFEFAVFDLPPLCRPAEAIGLYGLVQGVLLVVQSERVRWPVAKRFVSDLERSGANTLGAVMNRRRQHIPGWLYRTL